MKINKFFVISTLFVAVGLLGGCHYGVADDYHDYSDQGSYREGFRDGRAYERRREGRRDRRDDRDRRWGRR
ncbi:MAG: hypothetical protein OEN50_16125 [Deltaproteobacteria bacterium]|nr:hypothetical protein [Deltaproteobacteria bacterium]